MQKFILQGNIEIFLLVYMLIFIPPSPHHFFYSVSSLAWFMSNQETSFVTIGQRILANPLK